MSEEIPSFVRTWLDETLREAPDPGHLNAAVLRAIHLAPQPRRWLPQSRTRRFRTMFTALTSIAAAASVAVLGGYLLSDGSTTQVPVERALVAAQASGSPEVSRDLDPMETAWVTGTIPWSGTPVGSPEVSVEDGVTRSRTYVWVNQGPVRMSDPRLTGTMSVTYNQDTHALTDLEGCSPDTREERQDVPPCQFTVHSGSQRIVNEEGSWEGTTMALARGSRNAGGTISDVIVLTGSGAYEGLTAYLLFDLSTDPTTVFGVIFPGEMPPIATFE